MSHRDSASSTGRTTARLPARGTQQVDTPHIHRRHAYVAQAGEGGRPDAGASVRGNQRYDLSLPGQ
jgi:hypothetical protein